MKRSPLRFWKDESGAVAPTVGVTLFLLIGVGGVAFDYARMAALDSELQNAADHAALAAAGQLDGRANARNRATSAAQELIANITVFANDGNSAAVTVPTIIYYSDYDAATGAKGPVATTDAEATYVLVTVGARTANFALTPVIAMMDSGPMTASAFAGLGSAICNSPPVMLCNPSEPTNNTNTEFPFDGNAMAGVGLRLISGNATVPGNFGFLETGFGTGAANLARALGYNTPPGECAPSDGVTTKPGLNAAVMDAVNTRFDLDTNGSTTCPAGGTCSPSRNVRKDLVRGNQCGTTGQQGWQESPVPYRPTNTTPLSATNPMNGSAVYPDIMGHPRDICHAVSNAGTCSGGRVGNGTWDRDAYFQVNYGWNHSQWMTNTGLSATASRYAVYQWEMAHPLPNGAGQPGIDTPQTVGGNKTGHGAPVCRSPVITPNATTPDRRRISAAVVNCVALGLNGSETGVPVERWIDIFLVEPSIQRGNGPTLRTEASDIYVEVIGETSAGGAGVVGGQVIRRDVPRLIE